MSEMEQQPAQPVDPIGMVDAALGEVERLAAQLRTIKRTLRFSGLREEGGMKPHIIAARILLKEQGTPMSAEDIAAELIACGMWRKEDGTLREDAHGQLAGALKKACRRGNLKRMNDASEGKFYMIGLPDE